LVAVTVTLTITFWSLTSTSLPKRKDEPPGHLQLTVIGAFPWARRQSW